MQPTFSHKNMFILLIIILTRNLFLCWCTFLEVYTNRLRGFDSHQLLYMYTYSLKQDWIGRILWIGGGWLILWWTWFLQPNHVILIFNNILCLFLTSSYGYCWKVIIIQRRGHLILGSQMVFQSYDRNQHLRIICNMGIVWKV